MCHRLVNMDLKRKALNMCVMGAVLYGCETWTMRSSDKERIAVAQRKMERRMAGVTWQDKWSNERLRDTTGVVDWVREATRRKLAWADKLRKMSGERWARALTHWIPYGHIGRRAQGRPYIRWREEVQRVCGNNWWSIGDQQWKTLHDQHIYP